MQESPTTNGPVWIVAGLSALLALGGCGDPRPYDDDSRNPDAYAGEVKTRVVRHMEKARQLPHTGPERVDLVIEILSVYPQRSVGENEATYAQLLEELKTLQQLYQSQAPKNEIDSKITAIADLAKTLPGELRTEDD